MKQRSNKKGKPKNQTTNKRPWKALLIVVLILAAMLFLLEKLKEKVPAEPALTPPTAKIEPQKAPEKIDYPRVEQQPYTTSAIRPSARTPQRKPVKGAGVVAIIIDDMGKSMQEVRALMDIKTPITFSVIPGLEYSTEVAKLAHNRGYQVMIHLPMEPQGYPEQRLETNGLLLSQSDDEILKRLDSYFRLVPFAEGANNHMGSRFTEDEKRMRLVLNQLKAHSLFFIDSRTSPKSVGLDVAHSLDMYTAARNVFLDNVQDEAAISIQLEQLADLAAKKGVAIGICHPHKATIKTLAKVLPKLQKRGVTFVSAIEVVR